MTDTRSVPPFTERLGNVIRITGTIVGVVSGALFVAGAIAISRRTPTSDWQLEATLSKLNHDSMLLYFQVFVGAWLASRVANYLLTGRKPWPLSRWSS